MSDEDENDVLAKFGDPLNVDRMVFVDQLITVRKAAGNPAAEWRLRVKRQKAIDERLRNLGKLALLSGGSLLVALEGDDLHCLERHSNWRTTLRGSQMFASISEVNRGQLMGAKKENYSRLESAIQCFGQMLCLAVKDLDDPILLRSFNTFKVRCVSYAFASDRKLDEVLEHVKRLGKLCQGALLGVKLEPLEGFCPIEGETLLPFAGNELKFISEIYQRGYRKGPLRYRQAFALAQIGNTPRAMPYPSKDQVIDSIEKSLGLMRESVSPPETALKAYRKGLQIVAKTVPAMTHNNTHVSLLGSGTRENPRSTGGRARYLVLATRQYSDKKFNTSYEALVGKFDQFGLVLIYPEVFEYLKLIPDLDIPVGNIFYVPLSEIEQVIKDYSEGRVVPKYLGHLLNLTASKLIQELGHYDPSPQYFQNTMFFSCENVKFKLTSIPVVRADVSVEAGLKCRLITASMAAFAHLSQLPANYMRDWLSKDPFHRVGFEESDKLWEVLKTYRKNVSSVENP